MAEERRKRAHNRLGLEVEKVVTHQQLQQLKNLFDGTPLTATDQKNITTFLQLWIELSNYGTIKPGVYSELKSALNCIKAMKSLNTLTESELDLYGQTGPGMESLNEVNKERDAEIKAERQRRINAEEKVAELNRKLNYQRQARYNKHAGGNGPKRK